MLLTPQALSAYKKSVGICIVPTKADKNDFRPISFDPDPALRLTMSFN